MTHYRTRRGRVRRPHAVAGISMIEVLISVVILAFGMLGIATMQMLALRNSQVSLERSQATVQTYAILDAMRANLAVARIGGYNLSQMTCAVPEEAGTLASTDLHNWVTSLKANLGASACAHIACGGADCLISVEWDDSRGKTAPTRITTRTRL
ncbi:type IV pilus modification protein PilV [Agrilutibacter solisilvae]|uniref:Type IV pilus modification protein PilV n=1 Tax=Agrilutibacter solisilvae TaxID=2763317 RepID=A0A974XX59_9GAMM|nr:type IV pilus modification protein PilV [Lysobacter solisilvae]QSX77472.1 type IV pilus modification protein PilV [Lysobacter solisilvae]